MASVVERNNLEGIDNPAATEDNGTSLRPDLVISVQPQQQENGRAELPVSTLDWQSRNRGQFIPRQGLDFLIGTSSLVIQQTVELDDLTSKIHSENRYTVKVPNGETLYFASETSSSSQRCLCGSGRSLVMHLHDNTRQEALVLNRRLAGASCLFPCRLQEMKVITPPGNYIGRVHQQWTWMVPFYLVRDANEDVLFVIEGPASLKRSALIISEFKIMSGDSLREIGKISHGWDRELVNFATTLKFPETAVEPKHKALLLAATFLMSLERYTGQFLHGAMHGTGEYFWRYVNPEGDFMTYEGYFYCNKMHGHGVMSYQDGRVFNGLFFSNIRWGPGIESHIDGRQNIGLWIGNNLMKIAWKPPAHNLILDLNSTNTGRKCVDAQRNLMMTYSETINEKDEAIELLIKYGTKPQSAETIWTKLYPANLTDTRSAVFPLQLFEETYYGSGNKTTLIEIEKIPESTQNLGDNKIYFAWNNNFIIKHMMKHAFTHEKQLKDNLKMENILSDSRKKLKQPSKHELDCRTLLMASYLGYTGTVVQLINNEDIHPDLADLNGNSILMYATCGDHTNLIHFLIEAGASINNFNNCCCTALSIALMRFLCVSKGVSINEMTQALIPETTLSRTNSLLQNVLEWNIDAQVQKLNGLTKSPSKLMKPQLSQKRVKSLLSLKDQSFKSPEVTITRKSLDEIYNTGNEDFIESWLMCTEVENKYLYRVAEEFSVPGSGSLVPYLFEVRDAANDIIDSEAEEQTKSNGKSPKRIASKATKEPVNGKGKLTYLTPIQSKENPQTLSESGKINTENCERILSTINQLLIDGADPRLVHCPQPAILMAVSSGSSKLVKQLIDYGANINEFYPHILGYSILDIAITFPLRNKNLNIITVLLENGASTQHRLPYGSKSSAESLIPGPTLLHVVLAKTTESEMEEEIRRKLIDLLLTYNCDSHGQFNGRSVIDIAMTKRLDLFRLFIEHPKVNLNSVINQSNQNILTKMFTLAYFKFLDNRIRQDMLTNLLQHGADPLLACQNENEKFDNLFVYTKKILDGCDNVETKHSPVASKHSDHKIKKNGKSNEDKGAKQKTLSGDIEEYKEALELVTDWARKLHISWLRVKILKKLIKIIYRYKHRHWNMILNNIENKKGLSLWLSPQTTCLDTWTIMQTKNNKKYFDKTVLKYLLCIVLCSCRNLNEDVKEVKISATEKTVIESEVNNLLREYKKPSNLGPETKSWISAVLNTKNTKYNVCFECGLPLNEQKVLCPLCNDISFCNNACLKLNARRTDCHPCNDNLRKLIFSIEDTEINSID